MSFFIAIVVGTLYFTYKPLCKYAKISRLSWAKIKELVKNEDVRTEFKDFSVAQMQKLQALADSVLKKKPKANQQSAQDSKEPQKPTAQTESSQSAPESASTESKTNEK